MEALQTSLIRQSMCSEGVNANNGITYRVSKLRCAYFKSFLFQNCLRITIRLRTPSCSNHYCRTNIHRVRLALIGIDIVTSRSIISRNELDAFRNEDFPPNEIEYFDRKVYEAHSNEMIEILARQILPNPHLPALPLPPSELPSSLIHDQPLNTNHSTYRTTIAEPAELSSNECRFQASNVAQQFNRGSLQSSVQELDIVGAQSVLNPTGHNQRLSSTPPEAVVYHNQDLFTPVSEHSTTTTAAKAPLGRPPTVTFHCDRLLPCEDHCPCICHSKYRYKSTGLLDQLIGSLFIGYIGNLFSSSQCQCDAATCTNQISCVVRVSYTFPPWFSQKTLDILVRRAATTGPYLGVTLRNRVIFGAGININSLACSGNVLLEGQVAGNMR